MWQSLTLNFVENLFLDSFISHQPLRTNHSLHEIRTLALGAPCDVAHVWSSVSHLPLRLPHLAFPASGSLGSAPSPTHPLPPEASSARSLPGADFPRCPSFLTRKSTALARKRRAKSRSQHSQSPEVSRCMRTSCLLCNLELEAVALLFLTKIPTVLRNDGIITSSVCFVTHRSHFK